MNQRQSPRLVFRIQRGHQSSQAFRRQRRPHFQGDRVSNSAEVLDVRSVRIGGSHPDPWEVGRQVKPALLPWNLAGLRLLVEQMQSFVAGEEVDPMKTARMIAG